MPESKHRRKNKNRKRPRHTPPPKNLPPSPAWVPRLGVSLLLVGVVVILAGYIDAVRRVLGSLPGLGANWTLVLGFVLLTAGFGVLTRWR